MVFEVKVKDYKDIININIYIILFQDKLTRYEIMKKPYI